VTVLDALVILEVATLEYKRDACTPEVREALDFLQPRIRLEWLIPQFRYHAQLTENEVDKEAQQQVLRATFPGIRESARDLLGKRMDALAREFAAIHDMKVKEEMERLTKEYDKLKEPWRFVTM
jgi:hypothetical protein